MGRRLHKQPYSVAGRDLYIRTLRTLPRLKSLDVQLDGKFSIVYCSGVGFYHVILSTKTNN